MDLGKDASKLKKPQVPKQKEDERSLDDATERSFAETNVEERVEDIVKVVNDTNDSISHDNRGKAGNLWSAQIVENRGPAEHLVDVKNKLLNCVIKFFRLKSIFFVFQTAVSNSETNSNNLQTNWPEKNSLSSESAPIEQPQFSGELSMAELQHWINFVVERDRVNWGELNTIEDLWKVVNSAVKETGWQPEVSLKQAMLQCLESAKCSREEVWWQNHTKFLIK